MITVGEFFQVYKCTGVHVFTSKQVEA